MTKLLVPCTTCIHTPPDPAPAEQIERCGYDIPPGIEKLLRDLEAENGRLKQQVFDLQHTLYFVGMDLEQLGLNTDDIEKALGQEGIKTVEDHERRQGRQLEITS